MKVYMRTHSPLHSLKFNIFTLGNENRKRWRATMTEPERENSSRGPKPMSSKECDEEEHHERVKVTDYL